MTLHFPDPTATQRVLADQRRERRQRVAEQAAVLEQRRAAQDKIEKQRTCSHDAATPCDLDGFGEWTESNIQSLRAAMNWTTTQRVRIEDIRRAICRHYNISSAELLSHRRTAKIVRPRQIAMYLAKTMTLRSLPEIGRKFGNRDHTTVIHAVRKIEALMVSDPELAGRIDAIRGELEGCR